MVMRILVTVFYIVISLPTHHVKAENTFPTLRIYTTKSFMKGIGATAKEVFEQQYPCKIEYIASKSPFNFLSTLSILEHKPDLIMGINYDIVQSLNHGFKESSFLPLDLKVFYGHLPIPWNDRFFIPLGYGALSFIYDARKLKHIPESFEDLLKISEKIILIDPRTSTTGFSLLMWIKKIYGTSSDAYWKRLKPHILTITKSWSEATALFLSGEASMVLGYANSPAYYRLMDHKPFIKASLFKEGHALEISGGAVLKNTPYPELAVNFLKLLLSPTFQKKMVCENWSYPVINIKETLPLEFQSIQKFLSPLSGNDIRKNKKKWIRAWLDALS